MTTEELKHYYSIFYLAPTQMGAIPYRSLGFVNKFFTREEAANAIINNENNRFNNLTLTILEIFES